ncbi:MAG TPA: ABC transporter permease, partial [Turneriella sp.]|nr:ABC transporter permease [Turneriella sp.]
MMIRLVFASLSNRRVVVLLTSVSVALAVFLFTSVERLRVGARQSFTQTISGTHIIVGARTGQIPLLLSSLFHIGAPTQNISYRTFLKYKRHAAVSWAVPLSMGDSYRGFRVVGTTPDIFRYYRYGNRRPIELKTGALTLTRFKAVLGSSAARTLALRVGDKIILTHGISDAQGINDH